MRLRGLRQEEIRREKKCVASRFRFTQKKKRKAKTSGCLTPIYYCIKVCKQGVYSVVHCVA